MAEQKTLPSDASVDDFLAAVEPVRRRREGEKLRNLMEDVTGESAVMWGPSIVGFGQYRYRYSTGREGIWMKVAFSPRKAALSLYGLKDTEEGARLLPDLGPHTAGAGCVYVKKLEEIDEGVLRRLVAFAFARADDIG